MSVKIVYKEGGSVSSDSALEVKNQAEFSNSSLLTNDKTVKKYGTLEKNQFLLDGTYSIMPNNKSGVALWSKRISNENGQFADPLELFVSFSKYRSSSGINLTFTDDFCNEVYIEWYQDETLLTSKNFNPDNIDYFCSNKVENYNSIKIVFSKTNNPFKYAKLSKIGFGISKTFLPDELMSASMVEEVNPIGAEIIISTMDFSFNSDNVEYIFQKQQPIKVYSNEELLGIFFIDSSKRISKHRYSVNTIDYIGLLQNKTFMGDVYENEPLPNVINSIFSETNIPYIIDASLKDKTITGHIPICTARDALVYICFALGCKATTSKIDGVSISLFNNNPKRHISENEIFLGGSFEEKDFVTSISVAEHNFIKSEEVVELYKGTDEKQTVIFNEPMHSLIWQGCVILKSSANYAIIVKDDMADEMVLTGKKYIDQKTLHQSIAEIVGTFEYQNDLVFEDCTLINNTNYQEALNRLSAYYIGKKSTGNFKARVKNDNVGDVVSYATAFMGDKMGRITRKKYNLNTNNISAEYAVEEVK